MNTEIEYDEDWTKEDQKNFEANQEHYLQVMHNSCFDKSDSGIYLFDGSDIIKRMGEVFDAARETVCINGKSMFIYKNFDHYLEVNYPK